MNIDILLIMNNQGKDYFKYFDRPNVKMIVYFDIPKSKSSDQTDSEYELFTRYWTEEYKICFLTKFIAEFG